MLKEAAKNIDSQKTHREKKILLSNTFLTHRQMGEAEAIYKLMPNLKMKDSNVGCVFLQTGTKNERSKFLKSIENDRNWHDKVGMQVKGKEGLVVEKPDILDKYCRKHKCLGKICPSHFAKIYELHQQYQTNITRMNQIMKMTQTVMMKVASLVIT